MPRKKAPVPTPRHVGHVDKMKRGARVRDKAKLATRSEDADFKKAWDGKLDKPKPRVRVGTDAAKKLGIE